MGQTILFGPDPFNGLAGTALNAYDSRYVNSVLSNTLNDAIISTPINGSVISSGGQCGSVIVGPAFTNNQFCRIKYETLPTLASVRAAVRVAGDVGNNLVSGYSVGPDQNIAGNNYRLFSVTSGLLLSSSTIAQVGDTIEIQIINTQIIVRLDVGSTGVFSVLADLSTTNTDHPAGGPGYYINDAVAKFSNLLAGSATDDDDLMGQILT